MTSFNYAHCIQQAVESVLNQSYQDWELIIVDDGSSDNSVEIIKKYCQKDSRIKLFQHENSQNRGLKESILLGLKHSTSDWIAFLECDDYFSFNNLAKKVEVIRKNPDIKFVFNKVNFLWESEKRKKYQRPVFEKIQRKLSKMEFPKNLFYDLAVDNLILTFSCVMVEKALLQKTDFSTPKDASLDWWLWVHLPCQTDFYYLEEALTFWRLHEGSYIKNNNDKKHTQIQIEAYKNVYKKNNKPLGLLFFIQYAKLKNFFVRVYRFFSKFV